jgi:hypothetical protein
MSLETLNNDNNWVCSAATPIIRNLNQPNPLTLIGFVSQKHPVPFCHNAMEAPASL